MDFIESEIEGLLILKSPVWQDDRGFFREWFKADDLERGGVSFQTRQSNLSQSRRNVVRGLHYSIAPQGQAKVVTCVAGTLNDVIVDIRVGSPSYGRVVVVPLSAEEGLSVLLPEGVAHGFGVTSEHAVLSYLLSSPFNATMELEINPFDDELNVVWGVDGAPIVSEKDGAAPSLATRRAANELPVFRR